MNDGIIHKLLVHVVFALETLQTALLAYDRYTTFVRDFGDPLATRALRTSWFTIPILCGISENFSVSSDRQKSNGISHKLASLRRSSMLTAFTRFQNPEH